MVFTSSSMHSDGTPLPMLLARVDRGDPSAMATRPGHAGWASLAPADDAHS